jgi:hypothetical protein
MSGPLVHASVQRGMIARGHTVLEQRLRRRHGHRNVPAFAAA